MEEEQYDEPQTKETVLLEWTAPEFIEYTRTWKWYAGAAASFVLVLIYCIVAKDWFIIPIAAILLGVTLYYQKEKPKEVNYKITQLGFYIDGRVTPYNQLHSYWLVINNNLRILNIIFTRKYIPQRSILFYGVDPVQLREVLSKYLPEQEEREENIIEKLSRVLKI